jgi:hypothetical protein
MMTQRLARVADLAYHHRGRMVLAWIVAAVVIIGVGSSLAGEYEADYDTPGSESKAARDLRDRVLSGSLHSSDDRSTHEDRRRFSCARSRLGST